MHAGSVDLVDPGAYLPGERYSPLLIRSTSTGKGPHAFMGTPSEPQSRLRIVTSTHTSEPDLAVTCEPGSHPCPHDYDGWCVDCVRERRAAVKRGIRPRRPLPTRNAA